MLNRFVRLFAGDPVKKSIDKYAARVDEINALEAQFEALSDTQLRAKTDEFRSRLAQGESLDDLLAEAFAVVREASKRTIGLRHYDVQLIGGIVLHQGKIAEMRTGEGKTLVATMPMYLNALTGNGVHLITVNDYLARRDARWMAPIFDLLGLTVGVLQMASRTENGKKAFLVDLERESPHEDQHQLKLVPRKEAYQADITYGTNSEFGFDYLRDNMTMRLEDRVQRGHHYAIIDEVDNVLVDEARTPLIISGPAQDDAEWYIRMAQVVKQLRPEDYEISERDRSITLTEIGEAHVEEILGMALGDPERPEDVTPEQARLLGFLEQALRAQYLFRRNKDYLVQAGKVIIIDEFTGRLMPGRRWSDGLHQAVEAKEGAKVQAENVTYATITIQNYFRMYEKLAGMTGTALTEAEEFDKIYKLDVTAIPTNLEYLAARPDSGLEELEDKDEQGYKYKYYAREDDPEQTPVFWKRKDYPDVVYRTQEVKFRSIMKEILAIHVMGRPILVGTTSVELSDRLSSRLKSDPLRRLAMVLILRKVWMEKNNREEDGRQIAELVYLNQPLEQLPIPDMRKMARDLEISFNPQEEENLNRLIEILDLSRDDKPRLEAALQAGIPHQVLNARRHTEESQIIAGAGAFGAVTIATNMAGRGVDIKLGGEIAEEVISSVNRVLRKAGVEDPYDMTMEERRQALLKLAPNDYGIYGTEVEYYLRSMEDMERVKALGGLHVIGSERHEARRIDNQLRGRSARQGDPGSSRFYLSMEDELMRLFGGGQADGLMQRLKIDDAMPIEAGLVGRIVEGSQTRVEGANFDVRKHLLEYDDVLNSQRSRIYEQRDRIFVKEDLSEDVTDMLRTEVLARVPEALKDEEGPWKLLAWLDQIQPPLALNGTIFPSYTLKLLLAHIESQRSAIQNADDVVDALLAMAEESIKTEEEHVLRAVDAIIENTFERLEAQRSERLEAVDTFFQGLGLEEDEEAGSRSPRERVDELSNLVRFPVRLAPDQQRLLRSGDDRQALEEVEDEVRDQLEANLHNQAVKRLVGAVSRRLEDSLDVNPDQLPAEDWDALAEQVYTAATLYLEKRRERLLGNGDQGQIGKDLENALDKIDGTITLDHITNLLLMMPQGARATFDKKTHRRVWQRTTRLTYIFYAARFLESRTPEEIANDVLDHLEKAQAAIRWTWGMSAWPRLATATWDQLEATTQHRLLAALGEERCKILQDQPLQSLDPEDVRQAIDVLGDQALTEIYRQLLLSVMTELWVDYLTQMEALRVSVGLEAYAQRDPLVQYKARASELFQTLLSNMRLGVISRMFTYRPRDMSGVQVGGRRRELDEAVEEALELEEGNDSFVEMAEEMVEADVEAGGDGADAFTDAEPEPDSKAAPETAPKTTLKGADGKGQPARQGGKQKLSKSQRRRRNRR